MDFLIVKHEVADFAKWRKVFDSHAEAQRKAGLHILNVMRDADNPNLVVSFFSVEDRNRARAFTEAPSAGEAADRSGVVGIPEMVFVTELRWAAS